MNNGVILEKIKDYIFLGSNSKIDNKIILENGDWSAYLPADERQKKHYDTWNCVAFSACNAVEIYFNYLIANNKLSKRGFNFLNDNGYLVDGEPNFSDRHVGANAGSKIGVGNTGSNIANAIHKYGLVPEALYQFDENVIRSKYYDIPDESIQELGIEFNKIFRVDFESIWMKDIKEALKYAPVQVYVNAWLKNSEGNYYNYGNTINHAVARAKSDNKQIMDHYEPFIKTLTKDYKYYPSGYKYSVCEIINNMNLTEFFEQNDLLFVRNIKTGQFGRIMQNKLKTVDSTDRGTLMLLDDAVRTNGRGLTDEEWNLLPKEQF